MSLGLVAALAAAAVFGAAAVLQATAVRRLPVFRGHPATVVLKLLRQPLFDLAVALNLFGFALHFVSLRLIPLYLSQAAISASLVFTAVLAMAMLRERLSVLDWAAVAAVTVGLAVLAGASGDIGTDNPPPGFVGWLYAAIVSVAVAGLLVARSHSALAATVLGFLAGLGFAGSGIAARILPGFTPSELWDAPAAYALPLSGGLAFVLYSFALQRGSVTVATAPVIVMQTLAPAVVGIALLGDAVRDGWVIAAAVGLVITAAGAIALARFERGPEQVDVRAGE